jgi:hypothetical protein
VLIRATARARPRTVVVARQVLAVTAPVAIAID